MRIIAGSLGGRRLGVPGGVRVRPTADRVKESLFSILAGRLEGARVLDLFAGSGALGLESLSRGAREAVFVEKDPLVARVLEANIETLGVGARARVVRHSAERFLASAARGGHDGAFALVFIDPPYAKGLSQAALDALGGVAGALLADDPLVVVEHARREAVPEAAGTLALAERRRYGDTELSFYARAAALAGGVA